MRPPGCPSPRGGLDTWCGPAHLAAPVPAPGPPAHPGSHVHGIYDQSADTIDIFAGYTLEDDAVVAHSSGGEVVIAAGLGTKATGGNVVRMGGYGLSTSSGSVTLKSVNSSGIGLTVFARSDGLEVVEVKPRSPGAAWNDYCDADEALLGGDVITSVNGVVGEGLLEELRGGGVVRLALRRAGLPPPALLLTVPGTFQRAP